MPRQWTDNQLRAISTLDRDVCVAAGAGSGKTGVLVERFVRIVRESLSDATPTERRAGVSQILVITFTEKATKEMKGRIVEELMQAGMTEQRREVETAYISTIHGFCSRLLKENPFEAGVDPAFPVLEENEALRMLRNAVEDAVETAFADQDEDIIELVVTAQDERLFGTDISDPLAALAESVRTALGRVRAEGWRVETLRAFLSDPNRETASSRASELLMAVRSGLIGLRRELEERGAGIVGALAAVRQEVLTGLAALDRLDNERSWEVISVLAGGTADIAKTAQRGLRARSNASAAETSLQQTLARIKATAEGAAGLFKLNVEREEAADLLCSRFWRLLLASWDKYQAAKRSEGVLDNDDLQAEAVEVLRSSPGVRERCRRRFRYLMIDEFQDTNSLQVELIDLLHNKAGNNLFIVGDVQQSIYGFRNADPTIFRDAERRFRTEDAGAYVTLADNFRSRPEILTFINGVFTQIWQVSDPPFMALKSGAPFDPSPVPSIELMLTRDEGRARYAVKEAEALARRIQEVVSDGRSRISDANSSHRGAPLKYRDIALLLRALTDVDKYERAFHDAGIPYYIVGGGRGYYARFEVRDILNVLSVLETPLADIPVAATLRSPLVGLSTDTLFRLSRFHIGDKKKQHALYTSLHGFAQSGDADADERARITKFVEVMEGLRRQEGRLSVAQILETIIAETNLDARLLVRTNGRRRLANVRKLLQMSYDHPSQTVGEFIRRLRDIEKLTDREGDAPTEEEASNVVRILTIHKAKGLEFPVVILGDMARGMGGGDRGLFACDGKTLRLGCRVGDYKDSTYEAISEARRRADIEESYRVLYVALTRARERLILCGSTQQGRKRGENWADSVFENLGILNPPEEPTVRDGPGGVQMRVAAM